MSAQELTQTSFVEKLAGMRKLGKEQQATFRSTPEIIAGLDLAAARLATVERFDGRKLRTGHLLNALALWASSVGMEELQAVMGPKLRALESHLAGGDAGLRPGEAAPAKAAPRGAQSVSVDPAPPPARARRKA